MHSLCSLTNSDQVDTYVVFKKNNFNMLLSRVIPTTNLHLPRMLKGHAKSVTGIMFCDHVFLLPACKVIFVSAASGSFVR